jgi:hypothetical protein
MNRTDVTRTIGNFFRLVLSTVGTDSGSRVGNVDRAFRRASTASFSSNNHGDKAQQ